jgi:hypothetical protein
MAEAALPALHANGNGEPNGHADAYYIDTQWEGIECPQWVDFFAPEFREQRQRHPPAEAYITPISCRAYFGVDNPGALYRVLRAQSRAEIWGVSNGSAEP